MLTKKIIRNEIKNNIELIKYWELQHKWWLLNYPDNEMVKYSLVVIKRLIERNDNYYISLKRNRED